MNGENLPAAWPAILLSAVLLLWPAALNGYPIVFADTGTYLSQAIEHYLGWDRPPFYSAFLLPLHMRLTLWPVIVVQAVLVCHTLDLVRRVLLPSSGAWLLVMLVSALSGLTWLPWLTCEIMPDLFTPLLVMALALLVLAPERLSGMERVWLVLFSAFMIAAQQSSVPFALAITAFLLLLRPPARLIGCAWLVAPTLLAMTALVGVNVAGHGRASLSPFGNVFLLARVIYDGPGMDVLRRDCPQAGWRLCPELDRFPATSDEFLWLPDSPVMRAGGHKAVSADADAIIQRALTAEPGRALKAFLANWWEQLGRFESGDGFEPWPDTVSPWITREFPPFERAAYQAAGQTQGVLSMPTWLATVHRIVALIGVALCLVPALQPNPAWFRPGPWRGWLRPVYQRGCLRLGSRIDWLRPGYRGDKPPAGRCSSGVDPKPTHFTADLFAATAPPLFADSLSRASPTQKRPLSVPNPRDTLASGFAAVVLFSLIVGAAVTGGLSTPHDRYQSRLMWLPPCIGGLALVRRLRP